MKITVKAKTDGYDDAAKESKIENATEKTTEYVTNSANESANENINESTNASLEKQQQIDSLLEHFEQYAADSPDLIKDKDSYFNSKEFDALSNENFDFNKKRRAELEDQVVHLEDVYEQEKKKTRNTIPWRNYLVYLVIITSLSCCVTFSKYITEVSGGSSGTIAKFGVEVQIADDSGVYTNIESAKTARFSFPAIDLDPVNSVKSYPIKVKNTSDVTVRLYVSMDALEHHVFKLGNTATAPETSLSYIEIPANYTSDQPVGYFFFYVADSTVSDTVNFDIIIEQVD